MRTKAIIVGLLLAFLLTSPLVVIGSEADGKPEPSPQPITVTAGDTFDLEVPIQAWADSNYTVTFIERTRFAFPGAMSQTHSMVASDAILFKVPCEVEADAPDGEYRMAFEISWDADGQIKKVFGEVEIVVGEGTGGDPCTTSILLAGPAILAFSLLIVQRKRYP